MKQIYLDYSAATPMDERVKKAMEPLQELFYNPGATYAPATLAKQKIDEAKKLIAHHLGAKSTEIILTSGGSESNNLAIQGIMQANLQGKVLVSAIEHESVLGPAKRYNHELVKVDSSGLIDMNDLAKKLGDDIVLISIVHASNEIGTIQPLKEIAKLVDGERVKRAKSGNKTPIYLHSDACQTAGILDVHVHALGVDMLTINGSKIYGPPQTGALYLGSNVILQPQIVGGSQQRGVRSGTLNASLAVGLATAFDLAQRAKHDESARLKKLQNELASYVRRTFPEAIINGSMKHRLVNNLSVSFVGQNNERLLLMLEAKGILASAGAACAASSGRPSHVLEALGMSKKEIEGTLRFSLGHATNKDEIDQLTTALEEILASKPI